jgi:hypothetical protein
MTNLFVASVAQQQIVCSIGGSDIVVAVIAVNIVVVVVVEVDVVV